MVVAVAGVLLSSQTVIVSGTVRDERGNRVVGASVGTTFTLSNKPPKAQIGYGGKPIRTGKDGSFRLDRSALYNQSLVAVKGDQASIATLGPSNRVSFTLRPLRKASVILSGGSDSIRSVSALLTLRGNAIGYFAPKWGRNAVMVPRGEIAMSVFGEGAQTLSRPLTKDLVEFRLRATRWSDLIGKEAPPVTPTSAPAGFEWRQLRGKWVVIDFWATWCKPCVKEMPKWFDLYTSTPGIRDRFEILAIHSPDGQSRSTIADRLSDLTRTEWKGLEPPFPLIFDSTGRTHRAYGVEAYPTTLLVNPDGKLVGPITPEEFRELLLKDSDRLSRPD